MEDFLEKFEELVRERNSLDSRIEIKKVDCERVYVNAFSFLSFIEGKAYLGDYTFNKKPQTKEDIKQSIEIEPDHVMRVINYFLTIDLLNVKKRLIDVGFKLAARICDKPEYLRFIIDSFNKLAVDYAFIPEMYGLIR